jgi:hypothetical protein
VPVRTGEVRSRAANAPCDRCLPTGGRPIDIRLLLVLATLLLAAPVAAVAATGEDAAPDAAALTAVAAPPTPAGDATSPPAPLAAPPPPPAAPPPRDGPVTAVRPAIRVEGVDATTASRIRAVTGVAHVALARLGRTPVGDGHVVVAAIDPVEFRPLAPQVTADVVGVWERLDEGDAVLTHEVAGRLGVALADHVAVGGRHAVTLRVGALASNGTPPVAELLVSDLTGARLGLATIPATAFVAIADDASPDAVARTLIDDLGVAATVIPDPRRPQIAAASEAAGLATVWDQLALCESSGDWHINTGNGFYGGLQFLPESWWLVGGTGLPHEASREEQIHRAERLLAIQGWKAWPVCSVKLALRPPD